MHHRPHHPHHSNQPPPNFLTPPLNQKKSILPTTSTLVTISILPPELIDLIALELRPSDLAHCTLTNREWYHIFTTQLWRSIKIVSPTHNYHLPSPSDLLHRLQKFKDSIASGGLVEKGQLVETLHPGYFEVLELLDSSYYSDSCGKGEGGEVVETEWETAEQHADDNNDGTDNNNESDQTDSDNEHSSKPLSTTRAFKSMCTNMRNIHIGSGFDPTHRRYISEPAPYYPTPDISLLLSLPLGTLLPLGPLLSLDPLHFMEIHLVLQALLALKVLLDSMPALLDSVPTRLILGVRLDSVLPPPLLTLTRPLDPEPLLLALAMLQLQGLELQPLHL